MTQMTFSDLQEYIAKAGDLLRAAIIGTIELSEFKDAMDSLIPDGHYYYDEQDGERLIKEILCTVKLKRTVMESPLTACDRYKNWEVADYLVKLQMEHDKDWWTKLPYGVGKSDGS